MPLETTDGVQKLYGHLSKQAEKLGCRPELYMSAAVLILPGTACRCADFMRDGPQAVGAHSNNEYLFVPSMTERAQLLAMCIMHLDEMQ